LYEEVGFTDQSVCLHDVLLQLNQTLTEQLFPETMTTTAIHTPTELQLKHQLMTLSNNRVSTRVKPLSSKNLFLPCQWFKPAKMWIKLAKTWS